MQSTHLRSVVVIVFLLQPHSVLRCSPGMGEVLGKRDKGVKRSTHTMFIAALFTIARTWKQPKCPSTDEWIKKMWHIYTMEYCSAIKEMKLSYL